METWNISSHVYRLVARIFPEISVSSPILTKTTAENFLEVYPQLPKRRISPELYLDSCLDFECEQLKNRNISLLRLVPIPQELEYAKGVLDENSRNIRLVLECAEQSEEEGMLSRHEK